MTAIIYLHSPLRKYLFHAMLRNPLGIQFPGLRVDTCIGASERMRVFYNEMFLANTCPSQKLLKTVQKNMFGTQGVYPDGHDQLSFSNLSFDSSLISI